jgi:hypothetical protein
MPLRTRRTIPNSAWRTSLYCGVIFTVDFFARVYLYQFYIELTYLCTMLFGYELIYIVILMAIEFILSYVFKINFNSTYDVY